MRVDLRFDIYPFQYRMPIWARKERLEHNQMLKVELFSEGRKIDELHFSALKNIHHYDLRQWKCVLETFFSLHELKKGRPVWEAPYFGLISSPKLELKGELLFIVESVLLSLTGALNDQQAKVSTLYNEETLKSFPLPECLKIKIRPDRASLLETIGILKYFREKSPSTLIRLDGNRCFDAPGLLSFMQKCESGLLVNHLENIQYIEEPFVQFYDHFSWQKKISYALALDESLEGLGQEGHFVLPQGFDLVLRPSLLGVSACLKIMQEARKRHQRVILSSSYEAKDLMRVLHFMASFAPADFHGLDTLHFLPEQYGI